MSPWPQLSAVDRLLTNRSFPPRSGVGQKSFEAELIGAGRFSGAPNASSALARVATQMSSPPCPPGRLEAMNSWRASGDRIGQPSSDPVLSSELLPGISSIFWPVLQGPAGAARAVAELSRAAAAAAAAVNLIMPRSLRSCFQDPAKP